MYTPMINNHMGTIHLANYSKMSLKIYHVNHHTLLKCVTSHIFVYFLILNFVKGYVAILKDQRFFVYTSMYGKEVYFDFPWGRILLFLLYFLWLFLAMVDRLVKVMYILFSYLVSGTSRWSNVYLWDSLFVSVSLMWLSRQCSFLKNWVI